MFTGFRIIKLSAPAGEFIKEVTNVVKFETEDDADKYLEEHLICSHCKDKLTISKLIDKGDIDWILYPEMFKEIESMNEQDNERAKRNNQPPESIEDTIDCYFYEKSASGTACGCEYMIISEEDYQADLQDYLNYIDDEENDSDFDSSSD